MACDGEPILQAARLGAALERTTGSPREETMSEVPPSETKGRVMPFGGAKPATTWTWSMAWSPTETRRPKAARAAYRSVSDSTRRSAYQRKAQ